MEEGRGGAGGDGGRGGEGVENETTTAKTMNPAALERRRRRKNYGIQGACGLYRDRPFSTGPWLEPVLKGL